MSASRGRVPRVLTMFSLVLAGEAIFCLPFHLGRFFRPTFVDVFDISQTQLGVLGSIYGAFAMFAYLFGGGLADRFPARKLLALSLVATGTSGLYLVKIPSFSEMSVLFAFWGIFTIMPFWSALIRATREWGGKDKQGEAFGVLDGGRGLLAAMLATMALFLFRAFLPEDDTLATVAQKTAALRSTMYLYMGTCATAAIFVWFFVPEPDGTELSADESEKKSHLIQVLRMPAVWLQAIVIIAAYCTYKGADFYTQYAKDVWGWSDVESASLNAFSSWLRPVAAIGAGLIADRISSSRVIIGCFVLTGLAYILFLATTPGETMEWLLWVNVLTGCLGIFALRGIYFALLEESEIPCEVTGTAVGVVSFIGYTPEVFMPLLGGWLIDRWSGGPTGYRVLFMFLCAVSLAGIVATWMLRAKRSKAATMGQTIGQPGEQR